MTLIPLEIGSVDRFNIISTRIAKVMVRGAASSDQFDFGALLGDGPKFPALPRPWLLPDGRSVSEPRRIGPPLRVTLIRRHICGLYRVSIWGKT